jgi:hypothetical protein
MLEVVRPRARKASVDAPVFFHVGVFFGFGFVLVGVTFTSAGFYR